MQITFISNFINHHQVHVADALASTNDVEFHFIETIPMPESFKKSGYPDYSARDYVISSYKSDSDLSLAKRLINKSDIVILGDGPEDLIRERLKNNQITFHYSERWLKQGIKALINPRFLYFYFRHHTRYRNYNSYMLCASAYTRPDADKFFAYPGKCFKWGYFPKVANIDIDKIIADRDSNSITRFLWVARFLDWKHPELPVKLAEILKKEGRKFELNMYGEGEEKDRIVRLVKELNLGDCVKFRGNRPNSELMKEMTRHSIFLFTSDKREGWGAVVNEAMSSGCAVVASDKTGCAPFLIEDGINGMLFKNQNLKSLYEKVTFLLDNPKERNRIQREAYQTMKSVWSPEIAAKRFVELAKSALAGNITPEVSGPCSLA